MTSSANAKAKLIAAPLWEDIPESDPREFAQARTETINLVQWLARIANSYVPAPLPDERVILEFRSANPAFVTQEFHNSTALELRLANLEMQFLEHGRAVPHIFDPEEHSPAKVEAWLLVELLHRGIDRAKFSKKLPYAVPNLMSGDAEDHSPMACQNGLSELAVWFRNAASVLSCVKSGSRIVAFPQTLALTYISTNKPELECGFSIGDKTTEPHFFVKTAGKQSALKASQLRDESNPGIAAAQFIGGA
jgi:hypothetical protein